MFGGFRHMNDFKRLAQVQVALQPTGCGNVSNPYQNWLETTRVLTLKTLRVDLTGGARQAF